MKKSHQMDFVEVDRSTGEIPERTLPIVRTWLNNHLFPKHGEVNNKPSLTLPDQSLTVKQMLDRQSKGLPYNVVTAEPMYYGEDEMPDLKKMDLSEIQDMREFIQEKIKTAQAEAVENRKKRDEAERAEFLAFKKAKQEASDKQNQPATPNGDEGAK